MNLKLASLHSLRKLPLRSAKFLGLILKIISNSRSAEERKNAGNQLYKAKKYLEALSKYTEAIDLCPECPAYYGNRAACHMMLSQHSKALEDAKKAVNLDSNFVKGYVRIAKCCVALGEIPSAKQVKYMNHDLDFCISGPMKAFRLFAIYF